MKKLLLTLLLPLTILTVDAQTKYYTKTGSTYFNAGTGLEEIAGINKSTLSAFDKVSGQVQFSILIKGFEFKSQLMQDHFNENYMESDKFPKASFKGVVVDMSTVNFERNGNYPVKVKGTLEIHGVQKQIEASGMFKIEKGSVATYAKFKVVLADYKIAIPQVVADKLSKTAEIEVNCMYALMP